MKTTEKPNRIDGEPKNLSILHATDPHRLGAMMMCEESDLVWSQAQTYRAADAVFKAGGGAQTPRGSMGRSSTRTNLKAAEALPVLHQILSQAGPYVEESEAPA